MEDAPTPLVNNNDKTEKIEGFVFYHDDVYQVDFKLVNKAIMIQCKNTDDKNDNNEVYSYKLTEDEIIKTCGNYSIFINELKEKVNDILEIKKLNNSLLLTIFSNENKKNKIFILPLKLFNEEDEIDEDNINSLEDAIKVIKLLIKENKKLKKNFEEYKEKMDLNFLYNSFDPDAYKLDAVYDNLSSKDIIQNKFDFCLINKGIQHLFKKNIVIFECIYKSQNLKFEYEKFDEKFKNSEYSILIILTQDERRFGAFFNRKAKKNNNIINMGNMGLNNNINNPAMNRNFPNMNNMNPFMGMNNNINNNNNNNNISNAKVIFNSSLSEKDYYVFSFDSSEIFYSCNNLGNNIIPSFSIELSGRILIVKENALNSIGYKLNGAQQSNIMEIELYSIQYGSL